MGLLVIKLQYRLSLPTSLRQLVQLCILLGIGLVVAEQLARKGATVIITARNLAKGLKIQDHLRTLTGNSRINCHYLDLNDFNSIHNFISNLDKQFQSIHLLINNAGVFFLPPEETVDKFDVTFQTNYLGRYSLWHFKILLYNLFIQISPVI